MIFRPTAILGVVVIEPEPHEDERGFFARTWDAVEFRQRGLRDVFVQSSISFNRARGTLRGLHYQVAPHEEAKLVRCTSGAIFDVAVDLRVGSPTHCAWFGIELSDENRLSLYVPEGCAHGFLTLADDTEVTYQISAVYELDAARGVRFDDPAFDIRWPADVRVINERDATYPHVALGRDGVLG